MFGFLAGIAYSKPLPAHRIVLVAPESKTSADWSSWLAPTKN